ncbi:hypothetical protein TNCV_3792191 [Trichonephila clavipes]|nr:hypothetical protein TNCV_3792191 [Trichonephila clavipes]
MLQDYDTSFSRVYFSRPLVFFATALSPVPTFFSLLSLPDPLLYIVSRLTCCQVQAATPYKEYGKEDQISSSISHIKNLTSLTSSKYNELNGQLTLSEWTKIAPLKMSSMPNQLAHEKRAGPILDRLMTKKKIS